ncbi:MAG: DUF1015 family protein [Methanophagales archaeon ANME-1-THS]|nr:MAG: DUF1015 family protein [Methanophagales archaeon ANME-1-THS]
MFGTYLSLYNTILFPSQVMVELKPFKATILNPEIADRADLVCPVYDSIDTSQYEQYAARKNNVVHVTTRREGVPESDFLDYATKNLERFFTHRILIERAKPSFYIYGVRYQVSDEIMEQIPEKERRELYFTFGLVALVRVDKLNGDTILGHERTFEAKTRERYHLMKACGMNFSPILAEYTMPDHTINRMFEDYLGFRRPSLKIDEQRKPLVDVVLQGTRHLLWELTDEERIAQIQALMRDKKILILDGHHRYTAAYRLSSDAGEGVAYTLMTLVEGGDRALLLLPWHRCVKRCHKEELWRRIRTHFNVEPYDRGTGNARLYAKLNEHDADDGFDVRFGMYDGERFYLLRGDEQRVRNLAKERGERVGLAVISLHEWLIEPTLIGNPEDVVFTASPRDAIEKVDSGAYQVAFFLKPLRITDVKYKAEVEKKGLPQKSTLFLPKVAEGIVMWKWKSDRAPVNG